jgi:Ca-activated chloride channel family protein
MIMKKLLILILLTAAVCAGAVGAVQSREAKISGWESEDRTLSPYFFVKSDDPTVDRLPLKSTSAAVNITGVIADVRVTQVYKNEGKRTLEAVYVFPGSTRAAVYGMKMTIGDRTIVAKIREREQARREYEQAKQQGKSASLLEQQRPNVFQMNVANILPGDEIRVELSYTELLVPESGEYRFVYPTVVGPRYSNQPAASAPASEKWVASPYLHEGKEPPYSFDLKVKLASGIPLKEISSSSHTVDISYSGPSRAAVRLSPKDKAGGNRDFILTYRLAGGAVESGLLLSRGKTENFFLLMMEPPKRVRSEQIPPREYIFIVDVSGSMHGFPLEISKKLLRDLIGGLRPSDRFNVLLFAGGSSLMAEQSLPATRDNLTRALDVIDRQQGGGGTELLPAMKRALALPKKSGFSRTVVIATDGYVSVEAETFDLIRKSLGDANLFSFGIGSSVNRFLLEGMARAGMGEPFIITKPEEAARTADRFRSYIQSPVLARVRVDFDGFKAYDVEPPSIPDVLAERPVVVFGKWRGPLKGTITVSGLAGGGKYEKRIDVSAAGRPEGNGALRYLWARHRIALLADYENLRHDDGRVKEITSLGLSYNLLTRYTSFVAIDSRVRRTGGEATTVQQPLPMPEGVSALSVGGMGGARMMKAMAPLAPPPAMPMRDSAKREEKAPAAQAPGEKQASVSIGARGVKWEGARPNRELLAGEASWNPYLADIAAWYTEYLRKHPGVRGTLILRLTVGGDGKVRKVEIPVSDLKHAALEQGIQERAKKWTLPPSGGKAETILVVPLELSPQQG